MKKAQHSTTFLFCLVMTLLHFLPRPLLQHRVERLQCVTAFENATQSVEHSRAVAESVFHSQVGQPKVTAVLSNLLSEIVVRFEPLNLRR